MKTIKIFDYLAELDAIHAEVLGAVDRVLRSGSLILGPEVERFEQAVAQSLGGGSAVGVANGTDALTVTLMAAGIGAGDEVITVANTAVATANAIVRAGATPVFCDIDPATGLLDLDQVAALIGPRTKAVVPVHLYGNMVDMPRLLALAAPAKLFVLEDCAQAMGATLNGAAAGSFGNASAFSFYPTKNLGAYGDGGLCFTRDAALADIMRQVRRYGFSKRDYAGRAGMNSRLDELHAAILSVKLPHLAASVAARRRLAATYDDALPAYVRRMQTTEGCEHGRHLYVIAVPQRQAVIEQLTAAGIEHGIHYAHPLHLMPAFRHGRFPATGLPHTERHCASVLSLPLHPTLTETEVIRVCDTLAAACRKLGIDHENAQSF